jgi:hypothetical protein
VRPYLEKAHQKKKVGQVTQGVNPEFKPKYCKKRKDGRKEGGKEWVLEALLKW